MTAKLYLKSKKDQPVRRFHPWVFSNAIKQMDGAPVSGDIVAVHANKGALLGYGHYQEEGSISVRMLAFGETKFSDKIYEERIKNAWNSRIKSNLLREDNNCFRLIFAEGDGMPGLIADYYNGYVIVQFHSEGMYQARELLVSGFMSIDEVQGVYSKSAKLLKKFGLEVSDGVIGGEVPDSTEVLENGNKFFVNWVTGQKTGFFIDQRDNRKLLGEYSKGKKVLNTFCYTGGFSIYALQNGAELVHSLDSSEVALELVEDNVKRNGLDISKHKNICEDAMDYIKELGESYDVIILDPPAFAKNRHARHNAVQGYKRLNAAAMRQMKSGSILFTFSCSQVVDEALFYNTIVSAGISAERKVRVLHKLSQPADHPVSLYHPEGEYLKGLVLQID